MNNAVAYLPGYLLECRLKLHSRETVPGGVKERWVILPSAELEGQADG